MVELPEELREILEECSSKDCVLDKLHIGFYKLKRGIRGRPSYGRNWYGWALVWYLSRGGQYRQWRKIAEEIYRRVRLIAVPPEIERNVRLVSSDTIEARFYEAQQRRDVLEAFWKAVENIKGKRKVRKEEVLWIDLTYMPEIEKYFLEGDRRKLFEIFRKATHWETLAAFLANQNSLNNLKGYLRWLARAAHYVKCRYGEGGENRTPKECVLCGNPERKAYYAPNLEKYDINLIRMIVEEMLDAYITHCGYHSNTVRKIVACFNAISKRIEAALENIHVKYKIKGTRKNDASIAFEDEISYFIKHYEEHGFSDFEAMVILMHITLGSREGTIQTRFGGKKSRGGILAIRWEYVHWDEVDGEMLPIAVDVPESKTAHGGDYTWWLGCRLDLFFGKLVPRMLKKYWIEKGKPRSGRVLEIEYTQLNSIHRKFRRFLNWYRDNFRPDRPRSEWSPHCSRRTHAYLLIISDVPFEVIAGGLKGDKIESPLGVLWLDSTTMVEYYQDLQRKAKAQVEKVMKKMREIFGGVVQ